MKYTNLKDYLIAVDLDGTLIKRNLEVDEKSLNLLKTLSKNNYVVLASGRPWRSSKHIYEKLELNTPIINYNGAYIHSPNDSNFKERMHTIPKEELIDVLKNNKDEILNAFCEIRDDLYVLEMDDLVKPFCDLEGAVLHLGDFSKTLPSNSNGALLFTKPDSFEKISKYVYANFSEILLRPWKFGDVYVVELYNKYISKGEGVKEICKYYNIEKDKTIAFGDAINDLDMLTNVNIGVAMKGGNPDLLLKTKYNTKPVEESGIAYFLENFDF